MQKLLNSEFSLSFVMVPSSPLGSKGTKPLDPHIFFNHLESGRLKSWFCFLCFLSSFSIYVLISLGYSLFKGGETWVVHQISLADTSLLSWNMTGGLFQPIVLTIHMKVSFKHILCPFCLSGSYLFCSHYYFSL